MLTKHRTNRRHARRGRFRPMLETLEDRLVPTAGAIDPTFGHDGSLTLDAGYAPKGITVEGDQKIVVLAQSGDNFEILRLNPEGTADTSFGDNGKITGT